MSPIHLSPAEKPLVPRERFGALLHRHRCATGATLTSLARTSSGQFLPDELISIERGERTVNDEHVLALTLIYGLESRPLPRPSELMLVLDRGSATDLSPLLRKPGSSIPGNFADSPTEIAARFVAVSVLAGIDLQSGVDGFELLAEAMETSAREASEILVRIMAGELVDLGGLVEALSARVIVAQSGLLLGTNSVGQLLLAPRPGCSQSGPHAPPAGLLSDLVDRMATTSRAVQS